MSTFLYDAFDCLFLSSHVHVLELIHTLLILEFQGTACSNQTRYLKFNGLQEIRTLNNQVRKQPLNHLAKQAKWLSCVVSTYLFGALECVFLSCQVRLSE